MADERPPAPTPAQLAELLKKLDEMMAEAERLRAQITRQLAKQRAGERQALSNDPSQRPRSRR